MYDAPVYTLTLSCLDKQLHEMLQRVDDCGYFDRPTEEEEEAEVCGFSLSYHTHTLTHTPTHSHVL